MEVYKALWSQDIMSTSIFTFHEKLLAAVLYIRKLIVWGPNGVTKQMLHTTSSR